MRTRFLGTNSSPLNCAPLLWKPIACAMDVLSRNEIGKMRAFLSRYYGHEFSEEGSQRENDSDSLHPQSFDKKGPKLSLEKQKFVFWLSTACLS